MNFYQKNQFEVGYTSRKLTKIKSILLIKLNNYVLIQKRKMKYQRNLLILKKKGRLIKEQILYMKEKEPLPKEIDIYTDLLRDYLGQIYKSENR